MPAFSSALAYFDALRTGQLWTNLVQAQDYFGAHTTSALTSQGHSTPTGKLWRKKWKAGVVENGRDYLLL